MEMKDENIGFSDIHRITDFSRFWSLKPCVDAMIEHNRRVNAERARRTAQDSQSQNEPE